MKAILRLTIFMLMTSAASCCYAEHSGLELSEDCNIAVKSVTQSDSQLDAFKRGMCIGVVRGVMESMMLFGAVDANHTLQRVHGCIPDVMPMEAVKVVLKFLDDHPERLHEPDTVLILAALSGAYPCESTKPKPQK